MIDATSTQSSDDTDARRSGPERATPSIDPSWTVLRPNSTRRARRASGAAFALLRAAARRELRARYRESSGRGVWNLVQPIGMLLIYGFVFTKVLHATGRGLPYLSLAWAGLVCWQYFQTSTQRGAQSFLLEAGTLPKVWYPRVIVPLTSGTAALVDLAIGIALLLVAAAIQGVTFTITVAALPLVLLLLVIWSYACALILAPLVVFIRDLDAVVALAMRLGFFATPVMYLAAAIPHGYRWIADINPIAVVIEAVRQAALAGNWPDWTLLGTHAAAGLSVLALGYLYVKRVENRIADAL